MTDQDQRIALANPSWKTPEQWRAEYPDSLGLVPPERIAQVQADARADETARADKAEAACAEMKTQCHIEINRAIRARKEARKIIVQRDQVLHLLAGGTFTEQEVEESGLGHGILSEQRHHEAMRSKAEAKVKVLVEVLELELKYHKDYTHAEDCECDNGFETDPDDCTCGKTECYRRIVKALAAVKE